MDNSLRTFSLMLEALSDLQPEIDAARHSTPRSGRVPARNLQRSYAQTMQPLAAAPSLTDSLSELGPLPRDALLLGLASDGLPVLLNLHDPHPGPLLLAADPGAGKTALLQLIAQAAVNMHQPADVLFGIISNHPDEWKRLDGSQHCLGIFPTYHNSAVDFLSSLSGWAHANKAGQQAILLLIDDLESMNDLDFDTRQTLRWLLLRGPVRRVWPIITMNAQRASEVHDWLEAFRTRIFGQIRDDRAAFKLTRIQGTTLQHLQAGLQFALREGNHWLKFWIPEVE